MMSTSEGTFRYDQEHLHPNKKNIFFKNSIKFVVFWMHLAKT